MTPFSSCPPPPKGTFRRTAEERTRRGRRIVVGLHKGDLISVREENTSTVHWINARDLYEWAEYQEAKRVAPEAALVRRVSRGKL